MAFQGAKAGMRGPFRGLTTRGWTPHPNPLPLKGARERERRAQTNRGLPISPNEHSRLARSHFASVEVVSIDSISHSKFNAAHRNFERSAGAEVLIICRP